MNNVHVAPGPSAGILFQFERALYWLAKSHTSAVIGIETLGDIFVLDKKQGNVHEEDKHTVNINSNTVSDKSENLWKTLYIWLKAATDGTPQQKDARLVLTTNVKIGDCLALRMSKAETKESIESCIKDLDIIASNPSVTIKPFVEYYELKDKQTVYDLIARFTLNDASSYQDDNTLKDEIISLLNLAHYYDPTEVYQVLLGWLHEVLKEKWIHKQDGWVTNRVSMLD